MEANPKQTDNAPIPFDAESLFRAYGDMVYRLALVRTRSVADAEDVLQEVFLRCLKRRPPFETEAHQRAWFLTVTINCSKSLLGSAFRRHTVSEEAATGMGTEDSYRDDTVLQAVMELPEQYRTCIHLFYYESYSVKEIANLLHRNESTIKSWLHRARAALRESLGGTTDV